MSSAKTFQKNKIFLLAGSHTVIDAFTGFLPPLLPLLMTDMKISIAGAGVLATILSTCNSLPQPIYGMLNDAFGKRFFVYLGPLISAVFICSIGYASSYSALIIMLALCGTGSAIFHPAAAALVGRLAGPRQSLAMSIFVTAGNFGHALSPLLVVPVANALGLQGLPLFFVAGALVSLLLFRHVPESPGGDVVRERMRWREISWQSMRILGLLQFIAVARAFVITGIGTFLPIYMHQKGFSLFFAGATATLFQGIGSLGGLLGGHLSDIFSRSRMMQIPLLLVAPCLLAFFFLDGWIRFVCLAAGGVALYLSLPLNVVMAIELFPRHAGTVSALIIGFAWGIGALLLTPFGLAAERFGLEAAMIGLTLLSLTAVAAAFLLTDNISKTKKELVRA